MEDSQRGQLSQHAHQRVELEWPHVLEVVQTLNPSTVAKDALVDLSIKSHATLESVQVSFEKKCKQ